MKINLLQSTTPNISKEQGRTLVKNMFLENDPDYGVVAYSRPGLVPFTSNLGTSVRALYSLNDVCYAIIDNTFYKIAFDGSTTVLGTLLTSSGVCQITAIINQILINDKSYAYLYRISENTFNPIDSGQSFPFGTAKIASQDLRAFAVQPDSQNFYISGLQDLSTWDALNYESAEGSADNLRAIESFQTRLYLIGNTTSEIWINNNDPDFLYARIQGIYINYGTDAPDSIVAGDNDIYWLGRGQHGQLAIIKIDESFQDSIVSSLSLSKELLTYSVVSDAKAMLFQRGGNEFYVLHFPTEGKTLVIHTDSIKLYQYSSVVNGIEQPWLAEYTTTVFNKTLVASRYLGTVFYVDENTYTDNSEPIYRQIKSPIIQKDNMNIFLDELEIDIESGQALESGQGSDPSIILNISYDGGFTWGDNIYMPVGAIGDYVRQAKVRGLGSGRKIQISLTMTDPIQWTILAAYATIRVGTE